MACATNGVWKDVLTDPAIDIGRRLKAARQRASIPQAALARELGVTQTAISYWEAGRRLPGIDQLMKAAQVLDAPIADLLPGPTKQPMPVGAVLRAVAEQFDDEELATALESFTYIAVEQSRPPVQAQVRSAGARDAAEELLRTTGLRSDVPVDVEQLAKLCGVRVVDFDFNGMVDGLVVRLPDGPVIGLDIRQPNHRRRRFTLAHELGHHLLRHAASFHVDFHEVGRGAGDAPGYNWRHERAANEFAANLLMPAEHVRRLADDTTTSVRQLAERFDVSLQAMGFRLSSLGLRQGPLDES